MRGPGALTLVALASCGRVSFDDLPPTGESMWEPIGPSVAVTSVAVPVDGGPRLALLPDERPVVSWTDPSSGNSELYVLAWTGTAWAGLGGSELPGGISGDVDRTYPGGLAVDPDDGRICHAWFRDESNTMHMKCWDGLSWIGLGGSDAGIATPGNPWWPSLTFVDGEPFIAWEDYGGGSAGTYAIRFDGTTWAWIGAMSPPGIVGAGRLLDVAGRAADDAWLLWNEYDGAYVSAAHWDGNAWTPTSTTASTAEPTNLPNLALGDRPYAAWLAGSDSTATVHLRAWDGSAWQELAGSATGEGIAAGQLPVAQVALAARPDGYPVVAYSAQGNIHVRAWDGAEWVAPGGQDAGGVSQTGTAAWPTLAVAPSGTIVVAWLDTIAGPRQVHLAVLTP